MYPGRLVTRSCQLIHRQFHVLASSARRSLTILVSSAENLMSKTAFPCALHHQPFSSRCMPIPSSTSRIRTPPSSPPTANMRLIPASRADVASYCLAIELKATVSGGEKSRSRPVGGCCEGRKTLEGGISGQYVPLDVTNVDKYDMGVEFAIHLISMGYDMSLSFMVTHARRDSWTTCYPLLKH